MKLELSSIFLTLQSYKILPFPPNKTAKIYKEFWEGGAGMGNKTIEPHLRKIWLELFICYPKETPEPVPVIPYI